MHCLYASCTYWKDILPAFVDVYDRTKQKPAVLVAYPYLRHFERVMHKVPYRSWCLDSGAFTAMNSGVAVDLRSFIDAAKALRPDELFGLDVIGDAARTRRNLELMWQSGLNAIPTFHAGSTIGDLAWCLQRPKIAIGGFARMPAQRKAAFIRRLFGLLGAQPVRIHAFGCGSPKTLRAGPFHTADVSFEYSAFAFARVLPFGQKRRVHAPQASRVARCIVEIESLLHIEKTIIAEQRGVIHVDGGPDIQRRLGQYDAARVIAA